MKLTDVCEFIVDCPHSTALDEGRGYPLIRTPNIGKGRLLLENVHRVSEKVYQERIQRGQPQDGDLIFAREAPAGNVAIIKNGEKVCLGQRTVLIRPNKDKVNSTFLAYYLLAPKQQNGLLGSANGSTVPHVNLPTIRNLEISLPSLEKQVKTASIIESYDDLIENNQKQIKLLEEAAQQLYKEWFVDLQFPGWENTKIVDGVPEGWTCTKLGNILKTFSGSTPSRQNNEYYQDGSIPWLKTKELNDRFILSTEEKITETALKSTSVHIIEKESVIMAMYGATIGKLGISTSALTCNQACCVFDLTVSPLTNEFLFSWLYHKKPYLISLGKGAAQPNLSQEFIQSIDIILPPSIFIEEYTRLTHPFFQSIKNNQEKIEHLSILRNQLLKNLLH